MTFRQARLPFHHLAEAAASATFFYLKSKLDHSIAFDHCPSKENYRQQSNEHSKQGHRHDF